MGDLGLGYAWFATLKVSDKKKPFLLEYIQRNKGTLLARGGSRNVVDPLSMSKPLCLSKCLDCGKYWLKGNCCHGPSYASANSEPLRAIVSRMVSESVLPPGDYVSKGGSTRAANDNCVFNRHGDGMDYCLIHRYCLDHGLTPQMYKPCVCSLFPLFAVSFPNGRRVWFCHCKETEKFSPYWWGLGSRFCLHQEELAPNAKRGKKNYRYDALDADGVFNHYRPAFVEQESTLRYFLNLDNELEDDYDYLKARLVGEGYI